MKARSVADTYSVLRSAYDHVRLGLLENKVKRGVPPTKGLELIRELLDIAL